MLYDSVAYATCTTAVRLLLQLRCDLQSELYSTVIHCIDVLLINFFANGTATVM